MRPIYMDFNATTPIAPSVQEAMQPYIAQHYGNPSSGHALGRVAAEAIEDARSRVAMLIGAQREEILFTSGGTESNNLAICGTMQRFVPAEGAHLIVSALEHPAVLEPAKHLQSRGYKLTVAGANPAGCIDPRLVETAIRPETRLVSVMHANNEIGTVQPIAEIAEACHGRNVLVHTDAAQSVGKIRVNVDELGVDFLTIAGHKFYAPKGVGALYVRRGTPLTPVLYGAGHEGGLRPGTENTPYIVALGQASQLATKGVDDAGDQLARLRDRLFTLLRTAIGEELTANGEQAERLPNTLSVNFPRVNGAELLQRIPELYASTGSACHSGTTAVSSSLTAIGLPPAIAQGTVRLSVGWYTSEAEVERAAQLLIDAWECLT